MWFIMEHTCSVWRNSGPRCTCAAAKVVVSLVFLADEQCVNRMCDLVRWSGDAARSGWQQQ